MNSGNKKTLCLFTSYYPFGEKAETFIDSEIEYMDKYYDEIYVFPAIKEGKERRQLPPKFKIIHINNDWNKSSKRLLFSNLFFLIRTIAEELYYNPHRLTFLKKIRLNKNLFLHRLFVSEQLAEIIKKNGIQNAVLYCYWLNNWSTSLGILVHKRQIKKFVSRAHGFDIYEERWKDGYIPFRYFQMKNVGKIYSVSEKGANYLKNLFNNKFRDKINVSYLGVKESELNPFNASGIFTLVSCANPIRLKRIHLIVDVLKSINFPLHWVHFGDGPLLENIKMLSNDLPENITVEFKGHVPNKDVLEYYKNNSVNLHLLVSELEGLPMSLIEASSFGIPLMATNVGGVAEIVNENTGKLLDTDFDPKEVAEKISAFKDSEMNSIAFRLNVRNYWEKKFNSEQNYRTFYNNITE